MCWPRRQPGSDASGRLGEQRPGGHGGGWCRRAGARCRRRARSRAWPRRMAMNAGWPSGKTVAQPTPAWVSSCSISSALRSANASVSAAMRASSPSGSWSPERCFERGAFLVVGRGEEDPAVAGLVQPVQRIEAVLLGIGHGGRRLALDRSPRRRSRSRRCRRSSTSTGTARRRCAAGGTART